MFFIHSPAIWLLLPYAHFSDNEEHELQLAVFLGFIFTRLSCENTSSRQNNIASISHALNAKGSPMRIYL